jgi:hypothetical protein
MTGINVKIQKKKDSSPILGKKLVPYLVLGTAGILEDLFNRINSICGRGCSGGWQKIRS